MTNLLKLSSAYLLIALLTACGGSGSDDSVTNHPEKAVGKISEDIQGYYEANVKADNGDELLLTMLVKPNGEYFGNFNNSLSNISNFKREIFSVYSGKFNGSNSGLTTRITEFDNANFKSIIRKYNATASFIPKVTLNLDLTKSDSNIDHKLYKLNYIDLKSLSFDKFTSGSYNSISQLGFNESFASMNIYDTEKVNVKRVTVEPKANCFFDGKMTDNNYDVNFYDYNGTYKGKGCPTGTTGQYNGVVYALNNIFIMIGTNKDKSSEMRLVIPGFKK